jgi:hypothetical protein
MNKQTRRGVDEGIVAYGYGLILCKAEGLSWSSSVAMIFLSIGIRIGISA